MLFKIEKFFDRFADIVGSIVSILLILMVFNVFYDAIMRYLFNTNSIAMQEMEWHLFSVVFLLGISYSLKEDAHVRVDIIYDRLDIKKRTIINIVGTLLFLIPFSIFIGVGSFDFVLEAYKINEVSGDPGGLTHRWIIKAFIPISSFLLVFVSIGYIIKNVNLYIGADRSFLDPKREQR